MTLASFGNHSAIRTGAAERESVRKFYREVLGCQQTKATEKVDFFQMGDNYFVTFLYVENPLPKEDMRRSIWLELYSDNLTDLNLKILEFGVEVVESAWDKEHLYFQAPGGQVYRTRSTGEDMSLFER
jgi:catechol 2,3-dioxygenase-like lactoylglutathione lyase family enzyme